MRGYFEYLNCFSVLKFNQRPFFPQTENLGLSLPHFATTAAHAALKQPAFWECVHNWEQEKSQEEGGSSARGGNGIIYIKQRNSAGETAKENSKRNSQSRVMQKHGSIVQHAVLNPSGENAAEEFARPIPASFFRKTTTNPQQIQGDELCAQVNFVEGAAVDDGGGEEAGGVHGAAGELASCNHGRED